MPTSLPICLSDDERAQLQTFVHRGRANARTLTRAHVLLKLDAGWSDPAICGAFGVGASTIWRVRQRYVSGGLAAVLHDRRQARHRAALSGEQLVHLVAIACTPAPRGPRPLDAAFARRQAGRTRVRHVDFARDGAPSAQKTS